MITCPVHLSLVMEDPILPASNSRSRFPFTPGRVPANLFLCDLSISFYLCADPPSIDDSPPLSLLSWF